MQAITRQDLESMNTTEHRDFVLINVLAPDEFNKQHIRTSINIPASDQRFTSEVEKVTGNKEREVVVYCANFDCPASTDAARKLDEAGFNNVYDYEGGTQDWMENHRH